MKLPTLGVVVVEICKKSRSRWIEGLLVARLFLYEGVWIGLRHKWRGFRYFGDRSLRNRNMLLKMSRKMRVRMRDHWSFGSFNQTRFKRDEARRRRRWARNCGKRTSCRDRSSSSCRTDRYRYGARRRRSDGLRPAGNREYRGMGEQ